MEASLYVRLEGVNLANFVEDVHDLSTIRGGSFLLLEAVEKVRERFQLTAISTGASSGLFAVPGGGDAATLRQEIEEFLHEDKDLRHATFVVDVCRDEFPAAREALLAMNRWRQFQQPTVAVPSTPFHPVRNECAFDHVRPAVATIPVKKDDQPRPASASVKARRDFGRNRKTSFYAQELRKLEEPAAGALLERVTGTQFVMDIEALAADEDRGSLEGKIAVVYFDGNRFGSIQKTCAGEAELALFDRTLKTDRQRALAVLLQDAFDRPDGWWTADGELRLETLLWGGDELIWVVPAWKGWEVVSLFYGASLSWSFQERPLTHAGGIVFCHSSAPIHRMNKIAKDLANSCKAVIARSEPPDTHAGRDLFAYQVLESFDEIGPDFDGFRAARHPGADAADLVLRAQGMGMVAVHFDAVRRALPRSKLHEVLFALRDGRDASALIDSIVAEMGDDARAALHELFRFFRKGAAEGDPWTAYAPAWLHIAELWDYAVRCEEKRS